MTPLLTAHQITISCSQRRKQKWPSSICSAFKPPQQAGSRGVSTSNRTVNANWPVPRPPGRDSGYSGPGTLAATGAGLPEGYVWKKKKRLTWRTQVRNRKEEGADTSELGIHQMFAHKGSTEQPPPPSALSRHSATICKIETTRTQPRSLGKKLGKRTLKQFWKGWSYWQARSTRHSHPKPRSRRTRHARPGSRSPGNRNHHLPLPLVGGAGQEPGRERQDRSMLNFLFSPGVGWLLRLLFGRPVGKASQILRRGW